MHFATRIVLILMLVLAAAGVLSAQETETSTNASDTAAPQAATENTTASDTAATDSAAADNTATDTTDDTAAGEETPRRPTQYDTRNQFMALLNRNPEALTTLLVLEPALLSNEEFLAGQPELARFVKDHPEIALQPSFYVAPYGGRTSHTGPDVVEPLVTLFAFVLITFALGWIVRTIIEQKRWNRLTRTQTEVHTKILDRFGTSAELLEYVKSPAGTKYLESAPIPLRPEPPATQNIPMTRVIWSVQLGVITGALGVGLLLVSLRFNDSGDLFALGAIALCIGLGFIGSAAVTLLLSRRLGLWPSSPGASEPGPGGFVR